jgi:FixJ family two-component response regulator
MLPCALAKDTHGHGMGRHPLIALVDDDPAVRDSLSSLLTSVGYVVSSHESAEELLSSSILESTACIITDQRMPKISGIELCVRLRADGRQVPIILISAFSENGVEAQALAAGIHAVLTKPFSQEVLMDQLRSAMSLRTP